MIGFVEHELCRYGTGLASLRPDHPQLEQRMGRIIIGVIIGVVLVIWLLASCLGAIF